jgi:hypothetical protein
MIVPFRKPAFALAADEKKEVEHARKKCVWEE